MNNQSVESTFARAWGLLAGNWIIVAPGIVVGIVVALINAFVGPYDMSIGRLGAGLLNVALAIVQYTYTTGMAGAAWQSGQATLADGTRAFERDGRNMLVAMVGLFVLGLLAAFLTVPTLGLAPIAYLFFFIYTFPAAVVGERPGFTAMADSCRIALARPAPTAIMVVIIGVIAFCMAFISGLLAFAPLIGPLFEAVILQALGAYVILVVVGEYLALRDAAPPPPAP